MKRRNTIFILASVSLVITTWIIYFLFNQRFRNEDEYELVKSISVLSKASNINELELAVGHMGHVFKYPDGWIAIRYRDNHESYSHAIALDSNGHWYKSDYHFCGGLSNIEQTRRAMAFYSAHLPDKVIVPKEIKDYLKEDEESKKIDELISSKKTDNAILIIKNIWNFKDIEGTKPK